jgi:hypothetical protein
MTNSVERRGREQKQSGFVTDMTDKHQIYSPAHLDPYFFGTFITDLLRDLIGLGKNRLIVRRIEENGSLWFLLPWILRGVKEILHE